MDEDTPYWNPRHETMPREQIEALQVRKLQNLVEWADAKVPWQAKRLRDAGVTQDSIQTLDDLRRIPYLTRDEWMDGQLEDPPFGSILAAPKEAAIRYHMTSGTTGRTPDPGPGRHEGLGVDRRDVVLRRCGGSASARPTRCSWRSGTPRSSASGACTTPARRSAAWPCPAGR